MPSFGLFPSMSPAVLTAVAVFVGSSTVRAVSAFIPIVLAHVFGASTLMDAYTAYSFLLAAVVGLMASAFPYLRSRMHLLPAVEKDAVLRAWAAHLSTRGTLVFALSCPAIAWCLTPSGSSTWGVLLTLCACAFGVIWASPRVAVEQARLQEEGRPLAGLIATGVASLLGFSGALVSALTHQLAWCAVALSMSALMELMLLRKSQSFARAPQQLRKPFPFKAFGLLAVVTMGPLVLPLIDQLLLVQLGPSAQAVWGLSTRAPAFIAFSLWAVGMSASASLSPAKPDYVAKARSLTFALLIASAGLLGVLAAGALPLSGLLFGHGTMTFAHVQEIATSIPSAALGVVLLAPLSVLVRTAYATGQSHKLIRATILFFAVKLVMGASLVSTWGPLGLGLSAAAAMLVQCAVLWPRLR